MVVVPGSRLIVVTEVVVEVTVGVETTTFVEVATDFVDVEVIVPIKVLKKMLINRNAFSIVFISF